MCGNNESLHTATPESHKRGLSSWHRPHFIPLVWICILLGLMSRRPLKRMMYFIHFLPRPTLLNWISDKVCKGEAYSRNLNSLNVSAPAPASFGFLVSFFVQRFICAHDKSQNSVQHVCVHTVRQWLNLQVCVCVCVCVVLKQQWLLIKASGFTSSVTVCACVYESFVFAAQ